MKLKQITGSDSPHFPTVWQIYLDEFPEDERRSLKAQDQVFTDERFSFKVVQIEAETVGLVTSWDLGFTYVEHLAIAKDRQSEGIGTAVMKALLADVDGLCILEAELPETEIEKRRIAFYKRLGFKINDVDYVQPPYSEEKNSLPLVLLSYPEKIPASTVDELIKTIHTQVYGVS